MTSARITVDGLWRCLCPSIDAVAFTRALSVPYRPRQPSHRAAKNKTCAGAARRRHLHATPRRLQDTDGEKRGGPPAVSSDTEAKTGERQEEDARPAAADHGERKKPIVVVDQGATEAWKGYFDVVYAAETMDPKPETRAGRDPLHDVFAEEEQAQKHHAPALGHLGQGFSSAAAGADTTIDALDMRYDPKEAQRSESPKGDDFAEGPLPTVEAVDTGKKPFDETAGANAGKDPFDEMIYANAGKKPIPASLDLENEWQDKKLEAVDLEEGVSPGAFASGSTSSMPTHKEGNPKTKQAANPSDLVPPAPEIRRGDALTDMVQRLIKMKPPFKDVPPEADTEDIYTALRQTRTEGAKKFRRVTATLVKHLLSRPGVTPNAFIYDTFFRAHALPEGSVDVVNDLLKEMRTNRVPWSSAAYHSVLRVLAVHPDYLIRNDMIREMRERWIDILPKGHRYIAIGLLRDEQYELALEKLDEMVQQGIEVDPWLFDIFTYVLGKLEFLDDAMRITRHRADRGLQVPLNIWYYLLDVCSKGQHHEATTYIWNRTVRQGIVNPSDGVCLNILNMAAVYGDTDLATQVIQYLAERGTRLARPHYEALADAYSMQGNVERAIEVYCIMYGAGAEVNATSVGTLCQVLTRDASLIDRTVEAMLGLKKMYRLPIGLYNAILNEMVKSSAFPADAAFARGLDLYRRIRVFVPTGPNWETFRTLLWHCTKPDVAQFLAGEMVSFGIRQNLAITELMFKVHVEHGGPMHRVKNYFYKVSPHLHSSYPPGSRRWQNIMDLAVQLVRRLIAERDPEAWRILEICRRNGLEEDKIKALRQEVEAAKYAVVEDSPLPDVPEGDWSGLAYPATEEHPTTTDLLR